MVNQEMLKLLASTGNTSLSRFYFLPQIVQ